MAGLQKGFHSTLILILSLSKDELQSRTPHVAAASSSARLAARFFST